jgi:tetratricopeptide (TPR) repeat protein
MAAVLLFIALTAGPLLSETKPWTEIRSPHFRLLTNGDQAYARKVLLNCELMRAVFANQFPHLKLDSPAPLTIFAAQDQATARMLLPELWGRSGPKPGGLYHYGWEREYAFVDMDIMSSDPEEVFRMIYGGYVGSLLHANFDWLPSWLDEGLAEFYEYTMFDTKKMYIGVSPDMVLVRVLNSQKPVPLAEFIRSPVFSRDELKTRISYIQAWAFTHFLYFGPGMEDGERLLRFIAQLQSGVEQKKAFVETIGNLVDVQEQYEKYIHQLTLPARALPVPPQLNAKDFAMREMSKAETDAELAAWFIHFHRWDEMRAHAQAALNADPNLSLAQEDMGFLDFNEGRDAQALKEFTAAFQLDNKNYIALFASIMASPMAKSGSAKDRPVLYDKLNQVIDIKPDFAPAYIELAKLDIAQGNFPLALALSRKATQLEPFRSGYRVLTGKILLLMGRPSEAAAEAAYVAQRWSGPDRDEAMELWDQIPAAQRQTDAPNLPEAQNEAPSVAGIVKQVTCNGSDFSITLDVDGKSELFKSKGFPVGFSDTLWVGRDHFTPCFHVEGLRAMLRYHPAKDSTYAGDLLYVGFRDELPSPTSSGATQTAVH